MTRDTSHLTWVINNMPRESALALAKFTEHNPHWRGAHWDDCLDTLMDSDSHLDLTEPLYEASKETQYPGKLVEAIGITLLYADERFATVYSPELQAAAVFATIANNGGWVDFTNLIAQAAENDANRTHYTVVEVGQTNMILCWIYGSDRYTDPPDEYIGPFTHLQALEVAKTLTCTHTIKVLQAKPSEWATT
jgi:hypothetical protein